VAPDAATRRLLNLVEPVVEAVAEHHREPGRHERRRGFQGLLFQLAHTRFRVYMSIINV
jgi:hypothetical protein